MIWKGKDIKTIGDLMSDGIDKCNTPEEAAEFMNLYLAENPHAKANIGYLAGYYSNEKKHKIFEWFDCSHPIFGKFDPTAEEAFKAGYELGKKEKRK